MRPSKLVLSVLGVALFAGVAHAQYPSKPITLISPYGPGGAADLAARTLASVAPSYFNNQPILVVNREGAGGVTGSMAVKNAAPDGYTLLLARIGSQAGIPAQNPKNPYKWDDFTFLGMLEYNPFVCAVNAKSPFKTFQDLAGELKANPGKLTYGHTGLGTMNHYAMVIALDGIGLPAEAAVPVPYKGGGAAATDLVGGHIDIFCQNLSGLIGQIQGNAIRALIVSTPERYAQIKDVPTSRELGVPLFEAVLGWSAVYGPPNLPKEVVDAWVNALQKVKVDKTWLAFTEQLGSVPAILSPEETKTFVGKQVTTLRTIAEKLDIIAK